MDFKIFKRTLQIIIMEIKMKLTFKLFNQNNKKL